MRTKIKFLAVAILMALATVPAFAQNVVRGNVTDNTGEPVIGAGVIEVGTTNGTITDFDGNFQITVRPGATLEFSSIGYVSQQLAARDGMNVILQIDTESLEEVVVIGYGVQRKSDLTGAISQVKAADMQNRTATNINQSLQGKTAGVQLISTSNAPGAESSIRIRGFSSNSTSDPLYVVDGVRVTSINNIDPNDIESIEVLKDAASAAIYGAEAGNGVVLVTTKKGQKSENWGQVSYSFQYAIQSLGKRPEVMDTDQYIDFMRTSGYIGEAKLSGWDGTRSNWADILFENSGMMKHNLSFSNAGDRSNIYISLNELSNDGIVTGKQDTYTRWTGTINAEYDIKPWLNITTNNVISYENRSSVPENSATNSVLRAALSLDPLTPNVYPANNLPAWMQPLVDNGYKLVRDENGDYFSLSNYVDGDDINPNIFMYSGHHHRWSTSLQGTTALNIKPIKGLTLTSRLGYRFDAYTSNDYQSAYYANSTKFADFPTVSATSSTSMYYQIENFANYLFSINKHNFTAMAGTAFSVQRSASNTTGGRGLQKDNENFAYPSFLSATADNLLHSGDDTTVSKLSFFGRLSYDYASRYLLQVTFRADAADLSILPQAQRWGYFPSVSAGWTISNEPWFPQIRSLNQLKLRASWGQNGSIAGLRNFSYANDIASSGGYSFVVGQPSYTTASMPSSTGNQKLKWETSEQTNVGIDTRFFNSRLTFSMDYYVKKTKDLIISGTSPTYTVGNTVSPVNAGNVKNSGFEFDLGWRDSIGDFNYSISGNLATLKNVVTYLDPSIARLGGGGYNRMTLTYFEKGFPVWYFRGYQVDHIDSATGDPVYIDSKGNLVTGTPNANDMTMIGSAIPDFTYGLTLNLGWKNFDLLVFGQGSQGNDIMSCLTKTDRPTANRLAVYYTDAWRKPGDNAKYARMDYTEGTYWNSDIALFDGSYFKIKQIQLGYTFPASVLRKISLSSLRLYASLDDYFVFAKYPGMDPEASSGSTSSLGLDVGSFPTSRKVVFGVNVSF